MGDKKRDIKNVPDWVDEYDLKKSYLKWVKDYVPSWKKNKQILFYFRCNCCQASWIMLDNDMGKTILKQIDFFCPGCGQKSRDFLVTVTRLSERIDILKFY